MYAAMIALLDAAIVLSALASAWLWWRASRQRLRRISRNEVLDHADVNRIVIAMNRTQILNSQAALATAVAAALAGVRLAVN